ncbi:GNAT family N-acetyltransferase, partial [Thermodesulfobacteriota bacterium]
TGLSLSGYLERGYTAIDPAYRKRNIADFLIKGLIERSRDKKIYTTIRMDNLPALKLTRKNMMILAATFVNQRTGNELGVFVNTLE